MDTGILLTLLFTPGLVLLTLLLCAFRLSASKPVPRPGSVNMNPPGNGPAVMEWKAEGAIFTMATGRLLAVRR